MAISFIDRLNKYLKKNWILFILIILSIYDLRIDLRLMLDFFTFSTLFYTIFEHPLAITVFLITPSLFNSLNNEKSKN